MWTDLRRCAHISHRLANNDWLTLYGSLSASTSPAVVLAAASGMAECLQAGVKRLASTGAFSHVYLANTAALEALPIVVSITTPAQRAQVTTLIGLANANLVTKAREALAETAASAPAGARPVPLLQLLDMNAATKLPTRGVPIVTNHTSPCLTIDSSFLASPTFAGRCTDPDNHAFWDVLHPTRIVHEKVCVCVCGGGGAGRVDVCMCGGGACKHASAPWGDVVVHVDTYPHQSMPAQSISPCMAVPHGMCVHARVASHADSPCTHAPGLQVLAPVVLAALQSDGLMA